MKRVDLPKLDHIKLSEYDHIYEPSEDSYLFVDALDAEAEFIFNNFVNCGSICIEIGSGTGVLSASLSNSLKNYLHYKNESSSDVVSSVSMKSTINPKKGDSSVASLSTALESAHLNQSIGAASQAAFSSSSSLHKNDNASKLNVLNDSLFQICVDINPYAMDATKRTLTENNVNHFAVVGMNLLTSFVSSGRGRIDGPFNILIFNPPYVPTPSDEIKGNDIEVSWAGGERGREVLDKLLKDIEFYMSKKSVVYILAVEENDPKEIMDIFNKKGFKSSIIGDRKARNELQCIIKAQRGV